MDLFRLISFVRSLIENLFFISVFAVAEEMRQQQAHLNDRRVPHRLSLFRCLLGIITLP